MIVAQIVATYLGMSFFCAGVFFCYTLGRMARGYDDGRPRRPERILLVLVLAALGFRTALALFDFGGLL